MRMVSVRCLILAFLLFGSWVPVLAGTPADRLCSLEKKPEASFFPEMAIAVIEVRRSACVGGADEQGLIAAMLGFIETEASQERLRAFGYAAGRNPLRMALAGIDVAQGSFPTLAISAVDAINVGGDPVAPADAEQCRAAAQKIDPEATCRMALDEFAQIYTYAHAMVEARGALAFSKNVAALTQEWDDFLKYTRSQTLLELTLNSYLYRKKERSVFTSPPERQIILLHPNFVLENVSAALEGDQTKEALLVEAIGVNWWRERAWYVPSGGSLVALYSDRAGTSDIGYGVAVHFKGVYTIGYALHDGDDGMFISVDLLKFLQDKRKVIESYQP